MDEYITLELPELDGTGAINDDDPFLGYMRKRYPKLRDWSFTDPLRESSASIVRGFSPSRMEIERLQGLIGLDDEAFAKKARSQYSLFDDTYMLRRRPQEKRDAELRRRIESLSEGRERVNAIADAIAPTPHAQPESILGNVGYTALGMIPHIAAAVPEIMALGPWGYAGLNTYTGNQSSQEQVYENLRAQGASPDEAYAKATAILPNIADVAVRGGVNFGTMGLLNKTPVTALQRFPYAGAVSPYAQTAGNIAMASGVSGAGAAGEQALTNYRSNIPNDTASLVKTGLTAAATTGVMGLINAGLNWRNLRELQREYRVNENVKPIAYDWPNNDDGNGGGNISPNNPNSPNPNSGGNFPEVEVMTPEKAARLQKQAEVLTKYDIDPHTDLWTSIQNGDIPEETAVKILMDLGANPEVAASLAAVNRQIGDISRRANNLFNTPKTTQQDIPKQPTEIVVPLEELRNDSLFYRPEPKTQAPSNSPVITMDKPTTPEISSTTPPAQNANSTNTENITPRVPPVLPTTWKNSGSISGYSFKEQQLSDEQRLLGNEDGVFHNGTLTVRDANNNPVNVRVQYKGSNVTFNIQPYGDINTPYSEDDSIVWYDLKRNRFVAPANGKHDALIQPVIDAFNQNLDNFFTPNNPKQNTQNTIPTPAELVQQMQAKKIESLERKYQRQADKANEVKSIVDLFNFGRNVSSTSNQKEYAQRENAHNKAIDELYTKPTSTTPRVTAFSDLEPYYLDDSYSDYKGGDNSAAWEDIPDTHLPDSTPQAPKVTAFSFLPNINKPESSHFKPNPQKPNASSLKPDMQIPNAGSIKPDLQRPNSERFMPDLQKPSVIRGTDGIMDFLAPPQPQSQADGITEELKNIASTQPQPQKQEAVMQKSDILGQDHFISTQELLFSHLNNLPNRENNPEEHNRRIEEYEQKLRKAERKNNELFNRIESPEKLTALLNEADDSVINTFSHLGEAANPSREQKIASAVLSRFPDYQPAKEAVKEAMRIPKLRKIPEMSIFSAISPEIKESDEQSIQDAIDSNIHKLETLSSEDDIVKSLKSIEGKDIATMAKKLGMRIDKEKPVESFARQFLKRKKESVTPQTLKSDTPSNVTLPDLEDSYTGIKKDEKNAMAESNKKALALFPDEQTMRDRLRNMHTPMLRAMSGLTGSGLKKDDFINAIVDEVMRKKNKPIPDGARLKAGEFSVPGINGTWTVKPNGAGNVFHIENKDIPRSFMIYDVKDNYFLNTLGGEAIDKAQAYFREHAKDFYDTGQGDNQQAQTAPQVQQQNPETPKKTDKTKLLSLGDGNYDEAAEQNLDILRRLPTDDSRKKLLNAQSFKTADLKRMREYIMRKYHVGMGVQGKRNDIINSIVKFISHDTKEWNNSASQIPINPDTQTDTTQPQVQEQERKPVQEDKPTKLTPTGSQFNTLVNDEIVPPDREKSRRIAKQNLDILRNAADNDERVKLLNSLTRDQLEDWQSFLWQLSPPVNLPDLPGTGRRKKDYIERFIQLIENEKNTDTKQPQKSETPPTSGHVSPVRVISFDQQPAKAPSQHEPQTQKSPEHQTSSRNEAVQSDSPVVRLAERVRAYLTSHRSPFSNKDLHKWAAQEFGGTIGEGTYDQKKAYDAMEMGINMFIEDWGINPQNGGKYNSVFHLQDIIKRILDVIPTQTNRTPDQVKFQQFSTPPTLAYLVNWLANIDKNNTVLEPSAGTGNLAVFAKNAGANLILNDYSESGLRADILDALNWGKVYREDALHLADILIPKLDTFPDRVIMNPPFSAAGKQGTSNSNQNGFRHVEQALQLLRHGGRLVAILGAGRDGTASSVKTWLKHIGKMYNVRALITSGGKAYQKYGTTFSNAIVVIDNTGETPKGGTLEYSFNGDFSDNEAVKNLFDDLSSIRNDIQGGYESQSDNDSTPPKPEPTKPTPDTKINSDITFDEALKKMAEIIYSQYSQSPNDFYDVTPVWDFTNTLPTDLNLKLGEYLQKNKIMVADRRDGFDIPPEQRGKVFYRVENYQGLMDILQKGSDTQSSSEPKDTPTPETQKADNQKSSGKRIIPDGAVLKEGSFTAKGHIHKEARYKVKPVKRQWLSGNETVDALEITSTLEPSFIYYPEHDFFVVESLSDEAKKLEHDVEKVFREHLHEFYELPQSTQEKTNDDIPDTSKEALKAESTSAQAENTPTQEQEHTDTNTKKDTQQGHIAKLDIQPDNEDSPEPQPVSIYSDYEPQEHSNIPLFKHAKPHTSRLVETTNMKNVKLPPLDYNPDLPDDVIESGNITVSQLEAIAYAGQAFSKKLLNGQTQGFILGDGTGSGKGRTIAGIIRDQLNHNHGNGKAVWFSVKTDLVGDARRDWQGTGNNPKDIFELGKFGVTDSIPHDKKGVLFSSYSTFITKRTVSKKAEGTTDAQSTKQTVEETVDESRIQQVVDWLGKDFDGVIAFDECHKINNLGETQGGRGKIEQSKSAVVASKLAQALPNARVLYVSATAATDPSQLLMFDRAGLWGKDTPFETGLMFAEAMREGGLNAMEMFARDAKSMGLFVSRSLDSSQVTYRHFTYHLSPSERKEFDNFSRAWRMIDKARNASAIAVGANPDDRRSESESDFRGAQLRAYKFLIISNRVKEVIRRTKEYLEQGFSVAIMTDSTFDALAERAIEKENEKGNPDLRDVIISPVDEMIDFVERYIPVNKVDEVSVEKPDGGTRIEYKPATDSHGKPIISQEALRIKNTLLAHLRQIYFNMSPLDEIINSLGGPDNVAEVTGRKHRLIRQQDGSIKDLGAPPKADAEREAFNNWQIPKKQKGKIVMEPCQKRVIIFSTGKGGTGFSLHSDRSYKNQQRRVLIPLDFGFGAINATQGFGRVNRSNQVSAPEYCVVSTDIPGEIRLLSSISRALGKMGAITAGERKSTTQGIFSEKDNLDSKYATSAMNLVIANMARPDLAYPELENPKELLIQMGLLDENDPEGKLKQLPIDKIFNRILLLDLDMQEKLMTIFRQEHEALLAIAIQHGQADVGTEYIRAQSVNIIQETTLLEDTKRGINTKLLEIEYTVRSRIRSFDNATRYNYCSEFYTDQHGQIYAAKKSGERDEKGKLIRPSVEIKDGRAVQRYVLFTPYFAHTYNADADDLQNKKNGAKRIFTPIPADKAKALWEEAAENSSKYHTETIYLVSGVMLPIWNQINKAASQRVLRITAPDGTSILGREIDKSKVHLAVQIFKANFSEHKYSAQEVIDKLQKRGAFVRLDNNCKIKFSTVNGEPRLEILNLGRYANTYADDYGLLTEIIGSEWRYFIPIGRNDILDNILNDHPVYNFDDDMSADDIRNEATTQINSNIPDSAKDYIIHPSFWHFINDPDDNPLIHKSKTPMIDPESEERYQKSKVADSSKSAWQHLKDFGSQLWRGRHDIPELANDKGNIDDSMLKAQEWLRGLKRERQANVHEAEKELRVILLGMSPDDFDLFQRAMELRDLHETREKDINASMPWGLNPKTLYDFDASDPLDENYNNVMAQVRKNERVDKAMKTAYKLMEDIRQKLIAAADRLGLFDVRDRLKRKHYFRHLVLEYYNMQRSGKPHPTFKNPTARGYMKHREGSDKDISSNWILAMGEVFTRMFDDIKILDTLFKLRKEYDRIEEIKQQALAHNMEHALANIMKDLQDVPDELRKSKAQKKLGVILNTTQARGMTRLFNLAKKGDLPVGNSHEWEELVSRMAEAGQLDNLFQEEQEILSRYIGWLSGLAESSSARKAAKTFLTGIKSRLSALKKTAGNDYVDWKDLIPEGYTIWSPTDSRLVFSASTLPEHLIKIAMENIDTLLEADASDIGKMITAGGDKQLWVIPENLADALDNIGKSQPIGAFGQFMTKIMGAFKQWVTLSPVNGRIFKYNYRNFFGDLEAVLQGNPGALYYFKQAAEELTKIMFKGGIATGTLAEFQKRGGGLTTEAMTELERPDRIKQFANLYEQKKTTNPLKWALKAFRAYIDLATTVTNFRESILRYAAFLSYIDLIKENNGVPPFYGLSKHKEVKAVGDNIFDIAFKLANENLGAYDQISANTQWLRDNNFVSFLSWVEVNASRYIRNIASIWTGNSYLEWWIKKHGQKFIDDLIGSGGAGNGNGGNNEPPKGNNGGVFADDDSDNEFRKLFRKLAKKSGVGALRLAITLAMAAPLYFLAKLWNKLMGADDNDPNLNDRNGVSLYLGKNAYTGENLYMPDIGSAWDALRTFGVDKLLAGDVRDLLDGRTSFGQVALNILDGPVSKFVSNANPFAKLIIEGFFGKRAFPSALNPTPIRDKGKFVAQSFGLDWYYDFLTGKPHKPFFDFASSIVNTANQDQSAYFYMLSRRKQFEEYVLGKSSDFFTQTRRGEALRNAKRAADLGDRKSLRKFLREFYRAGGTEQGLKISARTMEPLYGLNDTDELRFIHWLPKEERKILRRAMRYAERMKAKLGVWD